jgi:hypothetical protein
MFLKKKGQSTAEYAIVIGLVIAVAAGVLQLTLKSGIAQKHKQGMRYMLYAGNEYMGTTPFDVTDSISTQQEFRKTTVDAEDYQDAAIMKKGGLEERKQVQTSETTGVSIETFDNVAPVNP